MGVAGGGKLYAYRVRGAGRGGVVLWAGGRGTNPIGCWRWQRAGVAGCRSS